MGGLRGCNWSANPSPPDVSSSSSHVAPHWMALSVQLSSLKTVQVQEGARGRGRHRLNAIAQERGVNGTVHTPTLGVWTREVANILVRGKAGFASDSLPYCILMLVAPLGHKRPGSAGVEYATFRFITGCHRAVPRGCHRRTGNSHLTNLTRAN